MSLARAAAEETTRERLERLALDPLREFWLAAGGDRAAIDSTLGELLRALGARPRLVVTHGDFIAKNIHVDRDGRAMVIDWETATPHGLPLIDLLYFITRWAYLHGPPWRAKLDRVRRAYAPTSAIADVATRYVSKYCAALELPAAVVAPLHRLHFLYKARIKAETTSLDNPITQAWLELFAESERRPTVFA